MTGARRLATGLALAGALLGMTGCASSVDPIERLGRKAAERVGGGGLGGDSRDHRELVRKREARDRVAGKREARDRVAGKREARERVGWNDRVPGAVLVPAAVRHAAPRVSESR